MNEKNIKIVADVNELASIAAQKFVELANQAIAEQGVFSVALSGGSTPKKLYELLGSELYAEQIDWTHIHFFFGDERCVPPDSDESNFKMANDAMFSKVKELPLENIHRVAGEESAADAANVYEQELKDFFHNELPRFDLVLLGLGPDGHTASLFPDSPASQENLRWFVENWVDKFGAYRLTMTFPVINNASNVLFLVAGNDKAIVLQEVLKGAENKYPSQKVNPINGELQWLIDEAAASQIK
jgi:6-phosphogluconolactonase